MKAKSEEMFLFLQKQWDFMNIRYYPFKNDSEPYRFYSRTHSIVFFLESGAVVTTPRMKNKVVHENELLLVESLNHFHVQLLPGCRMFILSFDTVPDFMDEVIMKYLSPGVVQAPDTEGSPLLRHNIHMSNFVRTLRIFETGRPGKELMSLKSDEFFYLLRDFYDIGDVELFLRPIRSKLEDVDFKVYAMKAYTPFMSVKQLAAKLEKSPTTLVRLFDKHFKNTPAGWIKENNKRQLLNLLSDSSRTLSEIAAELNVSSVQQLSRYCKINFGLTPRQLRSEEAVSRLLC